jgi:hypothetical protein
MLHRRLGTTSRRVIGYVHRARTASFRTDVASFGRILAILRSDPDFLAFHEGRTTALPGLYRHAGNRMLGKYGELLSDADRQPDLSEAGPPGRSSLHTRRPTLRSES